MGKICIVSAVDSGMLEQVTHGENGFIVDFNYKFISDYIDRLEKTYNHEQMATIGLKATEDARDLSIHFAELAKILSFDLD